MNKSEPAFPVEIIEVQTRGPVRQAIGLTKREYFAGLAMQGLLASESDSWGYADSNDKRAADAVRNADALLAELNKEPAKCQP